MRGQLHAPAVLYPLERLGTYCTGGWMGPRADLDRFGKSRPPPGFDPRTVQPVASRYTDYDTWPVKKKYGHQIIYRFSVHRRLLTSSVARVICIGINCINL